jgi:hypothetical protein
MMDLLEKDQLLFLIHILLLEVVVVQGLLGEDHYQLGQEVSEKNLLSPQILKFMQLAVLAADNLTDLQILEMEVEVGQHLMEDLVDLELL